MKNKSILIVVLFVVLVLIIYSIVQVENKNNYPSVNESFDGNRKMGKCLPCGSGLINGDFTGGHHPTGFVPPTGPICSSIVQCSSPINSSYCLKLTPVDIKMLDNGRPYGIATYKILVEMKPKSYYFLSAWVKCIPSSSDKCPNNFFKIIFNTKNNEPVELVSPGVVIDRAQDSKGKASISGWKQLAIIFQVPDNIENPVTVMLQYIPNNGNINSSLLISGISLTQYHPLLNCFPVQHNVCMFLSVLHQRGNGNGQNNIFMDQSSAGRSLNMDTTSFDCSQGILLNKNRITGSCCCELGICPLYFTIGLNIKFTTLPESGFEFIRLFTSLNTKNEIKIIFRKDAVCCCYSQVVIVYLSHEKTFNLGYTNYLSNIIIQNNGGNFSVYKDGVVMTCVPNALNVDGKFALTEAEQNTYFSNKPMLINPSKCYTDSILHAFMLFCSPLSNVEISSIYYYFSYLYVKHFDPSTYKCLLNSGCKGGDDPHLVPFPFSPYSSDKIMENARRMAIELARKQQELQKKNQSAGGIKQPFIGSRNACDIDITNRKMYDE